MTIENKQVKQKIRAGIAAFKAGNRAAARLSLQAVLQIDPTNITALLWLAYLSEEFGERTAFLNRVLAIDPENERAKKGLQWAEAQRKGDTSSFFSDKTIPVTPTPRKKPNLWLIIIAILLSILLLATLALARIGQKQLQPSSGQKSHSIVMMVETFTPAPPTATTTKISVDAIAVLSSSTPLPEKPQPTATKIPTKTSLPVSTATSIATPVPPTKTPSNTPLPAPTATTQSQKPTVAPTKTPLPTATTKATATFVPPTATHTQTSVPTATDTASATSVPPTETPTQLLTPKSTETPVSTPTNVTTATPLSTEITTQTPAPTATATATLVVPSPTSVPPTPIPSPTPIYATQKWIEVDLSDQSLVAWEGNVPVMWMTVSTGLPGTPTVVGSFHIYQKLVSTRMVGPGYDLPNVPHTMYFYQGYALHGAYWHNNFGHPMSHGCVNLSLPDAERLFNWATPILPAGAWSVYATADNPGSLVVVHY